MDAEAKREVSPKTWNDTLKLLRATFKHLHPHLTDGQQPFHGLVTKATETVNREPFSVEELKAIVDTCAQRRLHPADHRHRNVYGDAPRGLLPAEVG
jgi:hypothetical protein